MSDTPRTDVRAFDWTAIARREAPANSAYVVDADFARQLERDNARLREALEECERALSDLPSSAIVHSRTNVAYLKARQALKGE